MSIYTISNFSLLKDAVASKRALLDKNNNNNIRFI